MLEFAAGEGPLALERTSEGGGDGFRWETWQFAGVAGDRVAAELTVPVGDVWGVVLAAHGANGNREALYVRAAARSWARRGLAVLAPDAPLHGTRAPREPVEVTRLGSEPVYRQGVGDLLRAVEALRSQRDTAPLPLGFLGFSLGTLQGVAFLAQHPPVRAAVLSIGGSTVAAGEDSFPEWLAGGHEAARATDPATYGPEVSTPHVLMMQADSDEVFGRRAAFALYDALAAPKQILFFPGTHAMWDEPAERYRTMFGFFSRHLREDDGGGEQSS